MKSKIAKSTQGFTNHLYLLSFLLWKKIPIKLRKINAEIVKLYSNGISEYNKKNGMAEREK